MLATNKKRPPNGDLLVGMTGFEPATTRPPGVYSTGLSYIPFTRHSPFRAKAGSLFCAFYRHSPFRAKAGSSFYAFYAVGPTGFEPVTSTMSTWRSNQLSYGPYSIRFQRERKVTACTCNIPNITRKNPRSARYRG